MRTLAVRPAIVAGAALTAVVSSFAAGAAPGPTVTAGPTVCPEGRSAAPIAPGEVRVVSSSTGAVYHPTEQGTDDPLHGTTRISVALESRTDSVGHVFYRASATLTKVKQTLRFEINGVKVGTVGFTPGFQVGTELSRTSGNEPGVSESSPWVDSSGSERTSNTGYVYAKLAYSIKWLDGTLVKRATITTSFGNALSDPVDTGGVDSVGSAVLDRHGDAARGSIRIDAGVRLYRTTGIANNGVVAVQPYATITKRSKALRVQINAIDLQRVTLPGRTPTVTSYGWPWNVTPRSSGTAASAFLSTAITRVEPRLHNPALRFRARVFYSVRWTDGSLSTGVFQTPLSNNSVLFPVGRGAQG